MEACYQSDEIHCLRLDGGECALAVPMDWARNAVSNVLVRPVHDGGISAVLVHPSAASPTAVSLDFVSGFSHPFCRTRRRSANYLPWRHHLLRGIVEDPDCVLLRHRSLRRVTGLLQVHEVHLHGDDREDHSSAKDVAS